MLLKGSKTGFVCKFSYFFGSSTSSMFIFRGNSRSFRCSAMLLNGVFTIKLVLFVTVLALQHPAQELKSSLHGNSRTFRRSATSGQRTVVVFLVFLWWCHIECSHIECSHIECSHIEWSHRVVTHRVLT